MELYIFYYIWYFMSLPKRKSPRWKEYDYSSSWWYFVTICTEYREHYFGEIEEWKMILNDIGKYCRQYIEWLWERRKTIDIHEYVIMPNHVHLLIMMEEFGKEMNEPFMHYREKDDQTSRRDDLLGRPNNHYINGHAKSMSLQNNIKFNPDYQWPKLWSIINMFKWSITKYAKQHDIIFWWQSRYHDRIIRTADEYERIKWYIQTNPENWNKDMFNE